MILERKKVNSWQDYVAFIQSWFGNNWTLDSFTDMKKVFGVPNCYPAVVAIVETYDPDGMCGSGYSKHVDIIDKTNLIIKRRKGHD